MNQIRQSTPKNTFPIELPFETAYQNILSSVNECYIVDIYKTHANKKHRKGEIAVMASNFPSGTSIWLGILIDSKSENLTEISLYWGNSNWRSHAKKVEGWAYGQSPDC